MKYMLLIYGDEQVWDDAGRDECYAESAQLARELHANGQLVSTSALQPVATATSVHSNAGETVVTDGPFAETHEQLGGYFLIKARDLDEAISIARRVPGGRRGTVEIRPIVHVAGLPGDGD